MVKTSHNQRVLWIRLLCLVFLFFTFISSGKAETSLPLPDAYRETNQSKFDKPSDEELKSDFRTLEATANEKVGKQLLSVWLLQNKIIFSFTERHPIKVTYSIDNAGSIRQLKIVDSSGNIHLDTHVLGIVQNMRCPGLLGQSRSGAIALSSEFCGKDIKIKMISPSAPDGWLVTGDLPSWIIY